MTKSSKRCTGCALPNNCEKCKRFVCNRCKRVVGWSFGCADDTPALCDDCAVSVQAGWEATL